MTLETYEFVQDRDESKNMKLFQLSFFLLQKKQEHLRKYQHPIVYRRPTADDRGIGFRFQKDSWPEFFLKGISI